ncbi:LysR substrate-binding domain-containing protein [Robbsia sp. KACC 23696]|uniref:LysR substrate-binding domain-containing protein n=1 Tax=Robbsia sp. KACC 23696 TaxID=3149231 RepID=UPI00325AD90C
MQINLRQVEVFRAIMVTGSVSGAAKLLCVSQPGVSRMIAHTERRLGLKLFERIKGRLYPTPEARRLFAEVKTVYQGIQRINEVANDLIEKTTGAIQLVVSPSLGETLIPIALARFRRRYPQVRVNLVTETAAALVQSLLTQQAEVGVAMFSLDHPNILQRPIFEDRLVVVLPESHPLARLEQIEVQALDQDSLIGYAPDTPMGALTQQLFDSANLDVRPAIEVRLTHIACSLVQAGLGIAIADEIAVFGQVWPGVVTRPLTPRVPMAVNLMYSRYEPLSQIAKDFVDALTSIDDPALTAIT